MERVTKKIKRLGLIMKVKELIVELQKCPQDYNVYRYNGFGFPKEFKSIEIYPNEEEVRL